MKQLEAVVRHDSISRKPVPSVNAAAGRRLDADDSITEEARDDMRSVSSADEKETSYPPTSPAATNLRPLLTPASASVFGQPSPSRQGRPSTAPANPLRRDPSFLRPSSSGNSASTAAGRATASQRQQRRNKTAVGTNAEEGMISRLQSDGWHTRQIQSLERSPAGTALLGVDF